MKSVFLRLQVSIYGENIKSVFFESKYMQIRTKYSIGIRFCISPYHTRNTDKYEYFRVRILTYFTQRVVIFRENYEFEFQII